MLIKRVLSALLVAPLLIALVILGPSWGFSALIVLAIPFVLWEYSGMTPLRHNRFERLSFLGLGTALGAALAFYPTFPALGASLAGATILMLIIHLIKPGEIAMAGPRTVSSLAGLMYGVLLPIHLAWLHTLTPGDGWRWVLLLLFLTWIGDSAAYFVGRPFGKHKLYPAVSPKKSWEGAIAGLIGSVFTVFLVRLIFFPTLTVADIFLIGIPASILGQVGDFSESLLKRSADIKDSGALIPGHGGILDRIDALVFAGPFLLYYALWMG